MGLGRRSQRFSPAGCGRPWMVWVSLYLCRCQGVELNYWKRATHSFQALPVTYPRTVHEVLVSENRNPNKIRNLPIASIGKILRRLRGSVSDVRREISASVHTGRSSNGHEASVAPPERGRTPAADPGGGSGASSPAHGRRAPRTIWPTEGSGWRPLWEYRSVTSRR